MSPTFALFAFCWLVFQVGGEEYIDQYSDEDVEYVEDLDWRLQRCLGALPELGKLEAASDLPDVAWLPAAKVRQYGTLRRPGDVCREEALDLIRDEGSLEDAVPAVTTCVLNHYKHVMAAHGIDAAVRRSLECVATQLKPRP